MDNPLGQIVALDQFHDESVLACGFLEPVDRGDVRMIQGRERLGLALEPRQALEVSRERIGKDLDGDLATERRVRRSVHLSHAPFADCCGNFVDAKVRAGCEGQGLRDYRRARQALVELNGGYTLWLTSPAVTSRLRAASRPISLS